MVNAHQAAPADDALDASAQAVFHQQWQIYRTMVDHNYLFHREVYGWLHRILVDEARQPFRFVDVGCGDAAEIVGALRARGSPGTTGSTSPAPRSTWRSRRWRRSTAM